MGKLADSENRPMDGSRTMDVDTIYNLFKKDKVKNANCIIDLLKHLEGTDIKKLRKVLSLIFKIFCQLIREGDVKDVSTGQTSNETPRIKYEKWLHGRYCAVHQKLIQFILEKNFPLHFRQSAMLCLISLLQKEGTFIVTKSNTTKMNFPLQKLKNLYGALLLLDGTSSSLNKKLKEYMQSPDFLFASLCVLAEIVSEMSEDSSSPMFQENLMSILELIDFPSELKKKHSSAPQLFIGNNSEGEKPEFEFPYTEAKKHFNTIWEALLGMSLTPALYTRCMVILPEKALAHLEQPVRLTDYFMNAYNMGGVLSLLAMHGVFILVTQHNLEYPDFYDKVYAIYQPSVFHSKYKEKFFVLLDKFFMSPYLPEYIYAAFIKRSCRLMLTAPSSCLILLLKFVVNLLLRCPSLEKMINNPNATSVDNDPFIENASRPISTRAVESSLWEVATLREHFLCAVARAANFIFKNLPNAEYDLSNHINFTYKDLYERASKIRVPKIATTFQKPEELFQYSEDTMTDSWNIL